MQGAPRLTLVCMHAHCLASQLVVDEWLLCFISGPRLTDRKGLEENMLDACTCCQTSGEKLLPCLCGQQAAGHAHGRADAN